MDTMVVHDLYSVSCQVLIYILHDNIYLIACEYGWWDYNVTTCSYSHQHADEHGSSGVLKGLLNLQCMHC